MSNILRIEPVVKDYAWGNDYFIADLLELEKDGPRAELWMGAHRQGSAVVMQSGEKLCDFLDANPGFCGLENADGFPYLLKVLAIAQSLSIQCHPDAQQAKSGFEGESDKHDSVPRSQWNYQDTNPKAEMLYALTPVTAMCGFRDLEKSMELLKTVTPNFYAEHLSEIGSIRDLFDTIYRMDKESLGYAEAELLKNSDLLSELERSIVTELGDRYFGDPGVFAPLFLNIIHLEKGQAVYLKPRVLHAYVAGNGVELMNNSDNVLRAGLTTKHMDLDELESVMVSEPYHPSPMPTVTDKGGVHFVCEGGFTLTAMENGVFENPGKGARILLCTEGSAMVNGEVELQKGQCCIIGSDVCTVSVDAQCAVVFMASEN